MQKPDRDLEVSSPHANPNNIFFAWSKLISGFCFLLLYAVVLAYLGVFNLLFVSIGFLLILFFGGTAYSFVSIVKNFFFRDFDFLRFLIFAGGISWLLLLIVFSPFPAFSGRDEGSYSNAAVYLANFHYINFHLPLIDYLKTEGLAHQSLNFPGFVITNGGDLTSQFSPAYFVWLGIFFLMTQTVSSFFIANGILILGGAAAFYLLLRIHIPRWMSASGFLLILFNFLFLWFPRFTLSENLAFFLFINLLLFLILLRKTSHHFYLYPVLALVILFPLTRPEGWWILLVTSAILVSWYFKGIIGFSRKYIVRMLVFFSAGLIFTGYLVSRQLPVYRRLLRDWVEWPSTSSHYTNLLKKGFDLGDAKEIIFSFSPSWQRFSYFIEIEWVYGVLIFGIIFILTLAIFLFDRRKKIFSEQAGVLIKITAILSLPFFSAFISPQISADHPWLLRRFFFVVLPCSLLVSLVLLFTIAKKFSRQLFLTSIFLGILFLPSLPTGAYFLTVKTDVGREKALTKLGNRFQENDFVFLNRESSGDGWRMWSAPLSSLYAVNAAYVYSPENIIDMRGVISDRFFSGKRSYVILSGSAFDYEHELKKYFNLILDEQFSFFNKELAVQAGTEKTELPVLKNHEYSVKIYLLSPK